MTRIILVLLTSGACLIACNNAPAAQTTAAPASSPSSTAEQAAREELVRRQEAQVSAQKLVTQGEKLYYTGKYAEAAATFEQAVRLVPRAPATAIDHDRAVRGLTDCYIRLGDAAFHNGDYAQATQFAQKALDLNPESRSAEDIIIKSKRAEAGVSTKPVTPTGPKLDETPEFTAKKDEIKKLFREGKILMNSGQYDDAEKRFEQILLLDPYNEDAPVLLKSLYKEKMDIAQGAQDETRVRRLWEVSDSWVPPISRNVQPPKVETPSGPIGSEALRQQKIIEKLNKIIIPEINYREAVVSDVITFLSDESRRLDDPEHVGVNIVLSSGIAAPTATPAPAPGAAGQPPPPTEAGATAAPPAAAGAGEAVEGRKITLSLRKVPLVDALKYVTELAGLKYRVESSAVIVLPADAAPGEMVTRSYPVNPGAFKTVVATPSGGALAGGAAGGTTATTSSGGGAITLGTGQPATVTTDVKVIFTEAGVPFPAGSSLVFNDRTSTIIIRNTPENIDVFERVLSAYNLVPSQVEIEAKFIEISQNDLDELGFEWQVGPKAAGSFDVTGGTGAELFPPGSGANTSASYDITAGLRGFSAIQGNAVDSLLAGQGFGTASTPQDQIGTIRGILTDPQFQVIIKALAQKQSADTLSAPKVTTVSGAQAQVRVVQEFIYPTTYTQPTSTSAGGGVTGGGAAAVTPAIPSGFQTREVGVLLNVTPQVGADGYTISLTLSPEVSNFLGFIQYGSPMSLASGNNVVTVMNDIRQPLFSSENVTTSVVIWDGQTVVLGGLMTEQLTKIDDKVPFLGDLPMVGRLFRSKVTSRSKRNLLIFVTARLIDPAGNPVHRNPLTASAR